MATLRTKLLLRNDTATNWTTSNPTLGKGEVGVEIDTYKLKIGDGSTAWNSLKYFGTNVVVEGEGSVIVDAVYENGVLTLTKGDIEVDVGVTSVKTTDDNVINLTPTAATTGAVTIDAKHATKGPSSTANTTKGATADLTINSTTTSGTIKIPKVTVDKYGHTTGLTEQTLSITIPTIPNISIVDKSNTDTANLVYAVSNLVENGHTITPTYTGLPTKKYVDDKIAAATNAAVVLKGTLGTGGTITSLPTAAESNLGDAYKVITAGTYANTSAKVGDMFICYQSGSTYAWMHIPSGDDIEDTWRSVKLDTAEKLGSGTSTGALVLKNVTANAVTVAYDSGFTFDVKTGYSASGKNYAIKKDASGNLYVNVPWSNNRDAGYGKITPANSDATGALTGNTTQIVAATYNENVKFSAANKWVVLAGTNSSTAGSDELKFAHALSGITADTYGPTANVTGNNNSTIVIPEITVDAAGHITTVTERTLTLKNTTYSVVTASADGLAPKMTANNAFLARVGSATNPTWNTLVALDGGSASTTDWGTITA